MTPELLRVILVAEGTVHRVDAYVQPMCSKRVLCLRS